MDDNSSNSRDPFFIVGYPRSGTTLLASLLSRHKDVFIPAETHFFRFYLNQTRQKENVQDELQQFCSFKRIRDLDLSVEAMLTLGESAYSERPALLSAALKLKAAEKNKSWYGEKTPAHMLYLQEIKRSFPSAKVIAIVRDGRDCVLSNMREEWTRNNPYRHAAEWCFYNMNMRRFQRSNADSIQVIRYEDLVAGPEEMLGGLVEFLGLDPDPGLLRRSSNPELVPEWEMAWKRGASSLPDPKSVFRWKEYGDRKLISELSWIMKKDLEKYGYEWMVEKNGITLNPRALFFQPDVYSSIRKIMSRIRLLSNWSSLKTELRSFPQRFRKCRRKH